jgi:hypothetical protein
MYMNLDHIDEITVHLNDIESDLWMTYLPSAQDELLHRVQESRPDGDRRPVTIYLCNGAIVCTMRHEATYELSPDSVTRLP